MNWLELAKNKESEIVKDTQSLLQMPSVCVEQPENKEAPFGEDIRKTLDYMLEKAKSEGFKVENIDNIVGTIEYGEGEEMLGILCHLDVVPEGTGWTYPPYGAEIHDNKIFARGALDDKGPTMAAYHAMKILKDNNIKLNKRVRLILGTDEETGFRCMRHYVKVAEIPTMSISPDAEFPLIYSEKGIYIGKLSGKMTDDIIKSFECGARANVVPDYAKVTLKNVDKTQIAMQYKEYLKENKIVGSVVTTNNQISLVAEGKSAHAAVCYEGKNAGFAVAEFLATHTNSQFAKMLQKHFTLNNHGEKLGIDYNDEELGRVTLNVGVINYKNGELTVVSNPRYPKSFDPEKITSAFEAIANEYTLNFEIKEHKAPLYVPKESELVQTLLSVYQKHTGDTESQPLAIGGGTYARVFPNAVAYGPAFPNGDKIIHMPDECFSIDALIKATAIYCDAIHQLTK